MKIPYYVTRKAKSGGRTWGYWVPCLRRNGKPTLMAQLGFRIVDCGEDGPLAWAIANRMNEEWQRARAAHRAGLSVERVWPSGSLGEAYGRFRSSETWKKKKPRTREDWERGWRLIEPVFGDIDPRTVAFEDVDTWYAALLDRAGVREAHRAMKIWRALWNVASAMKRADGRRYCEGKDPSLGIRRETPRPRNAFWLEGEAVRLVKHAWRTGYRGLAAALAVAWDTMLSPVDVRRISLAQLRGDQVAVARAKTGRPAIGTLSPRTRRLLGAYLDTLGIELHPDAPIFRTPGGAPNARGGRRWLPQPYSKDRLAEHFRQVRESLFPGDSRKLMDFRRSGALEAAAGEVDPGALAAKMASSIDRSRALQQTYLPQQASVVRLADQARVAGRARLRRERTGGEESKRGR